MLHDRIKISRILGDISAEMPIRRTYDLKTLKRGSEILTLVEPVVAELRLQNAGEELLLTGTLTTMVDRECRRCLKKVSMRETIQVEETVERSARPLAGAEAALSVNPDALPEVYYLDEDQLDVGPIIQQTLILGLAEDVLCQESCRGLCPVCGIDRNTGECSCESEKTDPRWSALQGLKFEE